MPRRREVIPSLIGVETWLGIGTLRGVTA